MRNPKHQYEESYHFNFLLWAKLTYQIELQDEIGCGCILTFSHSSDLSQEGLCRSQWSTRVSGLFTLVRPVARRPLPVTVVKHLDLRPFHIFLCWSRQSTVCMAYLSFGSRSWSFHLSQPSFADTPCLITTVLCWSRQSPVCFQCLDYCTFDVAPSIYILMETDFDTGLDPAHHLLASHIVWDMVIISSQA